MNNPGDKGGCISSSNGSGGGDAEEESGVPSREFCDECDNESEGEGECRGEHEPRGDGYSGGGVKGPAPNI